MTTKKTSRKSKAPEKKTYGEVSRETRMLIAAFRKQSQDILAEIGRQELRKQSLLTEVRKIEAAAQKLLQEEAQKLGIPEGQAWTLTTEGQAVAQ